VIFVRMCCFYDKLKALKFLMLDGTFCGKFFEGVGIDDRENS
jgi:hypothetical protein